MARVKISIATQPLDLFEGQDESFYLTESAYDLNDLNTRNASYSRQIAIPATNNNRNLLNLVSNERTDFKKIDATLQIEDITFEVVSLFVLALKVEEIEIAIIYSNFDIYDNIPDAPISDLNLTSYNFAFDVATFVSNAANTKGAVTSLHYWIDEENLLYEGLTPAFTGNTDIKLGGFDFFQKTIFREIVENAGYTLDDSLLNTNDTYNNLVLAVPLPAFLNEALSTGSLGEVALTSNYSFTPVSSSDFGVVPWDNVITDTGGLYDAVQYAWVIATTGEYNIVVNYDLDYIQNGPGQGRIELQLNGSSLTGNNFFLQGTGIVGTLSVLQTFNANDVLHVVVTGSYQNQNNRDTLIVNTPSRFLLTQTNDPLTGDVIITDWLPNIRQSDFFRDFVKFFNLIFTANSYQKELKPKFFKDYVKETSQDFSNNLDISQDISDQLSLPYYRQSEMAFNNDDLTRTDSNYIVDLSQDESLEAFGTILSIAYSNSDLSKFQRQSFPTKALVTPYYTIEQSKIQGFSIGAGVSNFTISTTVQTPQFQSGDYIIYGGSRNVIMKISQRTGLGTGIFYNNNVAAYNNVDAILVKLSYNDLTPRHGILEDNESGGNPATIHVNSNEFGSINGNGTSVNCKEFRALTMQDIHDEFYIDLFKAVRVPKVITCWMVIDVLELYKLDYTRPIYIRQLNGNYHINKIEQWKLSTSARVQLVRIDPFAEAISRI